MNLHEEYQSLCKEEIVTIRFLFHPKTSNTLETIKEFPMKRQNSIEEMVGETISELNKELPVFLKKKSIKHFLPYRNMSVEIKNNIVEICYHFDNEYYKFIYESHPMYVMTPLVIPPKLNNLFYAHGMDKGWYDPACFVSDK